VKSIEEFLSTCCLNWSTVQWNTSTKINMRKIIPKHWHEIFCWLEAGNTPYAFIDNHSLNISLTSLRKHIFFVARKPVCYVEIFVSCTFVFVRLLARVSQAASKTMRLFDVAKYLPRRTYKRRVETLLLTCLLLAVQFLGEAPWRCIVFRCCCQWWHTCKQRVSRYDNKTNKRTSRCIYRASLYNWLSFTNKCTKDKFVTDYFIRGFPLYVFQQFTLPSSGGSIWFVHRPMYVNIRLYKIV
jgi:hypothetical protein